MKKFPRIFFVTVYFHHNFVVLYLCMAVTDIKYSKKGYEMVTTNYYNIELIVLSPSYPEFNLYLCIS